MVAQRLLPTCQNLTDVEECGSRMSVWSAYLRNILLFSYTEQTVSGREISTAEITLTELTIRKTDIDTGST